MFLAGKPGKKNPGTGPDTHLKEITFVDDISNRVPEPGIKTAGRVFVSFSAPANAGKFAGK